MSEQERDEDEPVGRIEGPFVTGGGTTVDGEPIGTEVASARGATGSGAGRGDLSGEGPGGTTGPATPGEDPDAVSGSAAAPGTELGGGALGGDTREPPELDADAVDETGALDDEGETLRDVPSLRDDEPYPQATEDRQDTFDQRRTTD